MKNNPTSALLSSLLLLVALFSTPVIAADEAQAQAKKEMELLAGKVLTESLKQLQQSGAIYPFAVLMDKNEEVNLVGYSGVPEARPSPEAYAWSLVHVVRDKTNENSTVRVAALAKMHSAQMNERTVTGIWILVDHIDAPAWVVFQPLVPGDKPKHYSLGEQIYEPSNEQLFVLK